MSQWGTWLSEQNVVFSLSLNGEMHKFYAMNFVMKLLVSP